MTQSNWHVATAAEAIAAAQFARFGYDVSVQYGANQPEYDLMIASGELMLKISVKGSKDGSWGLSQSQLSKIRNADYHGAADAWLVRHKPRTAMCLVQFKGVADHELPRVYLAWPSEIAARLKEASGGRGDTILFELHTRGPKAAGAGTVERIPDTWRMSRDRVEQLLTEKLAAVTKIDPGALGVIVKSPAGNHASGPNKCPECPHVFRKGWGGIDAHWKAEHDEIMPYEEAWPLIKSGTYERKHIDSEPILSSVGQ